jgi:hypothetical protein
MRSAMNPSQKLVVIAAYNEIAEAGAGVVPTVQEGTRYLDVIEWTKHPGNAPSSYSFNWSANWLSCGSSGTWAEYFPDPSGVQGAHDGDQLISSEAGAARWITIERAISCDIYAETGPDCGILEVFKDGNLDQVIDCYAPARSVSVPVATVSFSGTPTLRTVRVRVTGSKRAESSSAQIKLDKFRPTIAP